MIQSTTDSEQVFISDIFLMSPGCKYDKTLSGDVVKSFQEYYQTQFVSFSQAGKRLLLNLLLNFRPCAAVMQTHSY